MIYTYDYDSSYPGPAFPSVELTMFNVLDAGLSMKCEACVDSGANSMMISSKILHTV